MVGCVIQEGQDAGRLDYLMAHPIEKMNLRSKEMQLVLQSSN